MWGFYKMKHIKNEKTTDVKNNKIKEKDIKDKASKEEDSKNKDSKNKDSKNALKKNKKLSKTQKTIYNVIFVILLCVFLFSAFYLIKYFVGVYKSEKKVDELRDLIVDDTEDNIKIINDDNIDSVIDIDVLPEFTEVDGELIQTKYVKLYERNKDFIGWITIGDTVVDYPVMQNKDNNEFYLRKDFDGKYSEAGTLFADNSSNIKEQSDNIIIYGHNMKSGKMFHDILNYEDEEYYNKYKYIIFNTIYEDSIYEVIAAFYTEIYPEDYTGFKYYNFFNATDEQQFDYYVSNCRRLTNYETSDAKYGDKLITLSTCAYHTENGRFVVVAKKVSKDEINNN